MNQEKRTEILNTFLKELRGRLGDSIVEAWLFGSQARDDAQEGSDFDVLVVATGERLQLKDLVREAEWVCMKSYHVVISCIVYTPEIWLKAVHSPLGANIHKEGLKIA